MNHPPSSPVSSHPVRLLALVAGLVAIAGCGGGNAAAPTATKPPPLVVPVVVATVERRDVPVQVRAVGVVKPSAVVAVRSQITGTLMTVGFTEGAEVAAGQTLFTIDTRPLEQSLKQAEANRERSVAAQRQSEADLARDQANADYAEKDWQRLSGLPEGIATHDEVEAARAAADADKATVTADQAAIETAKASLAADTAATDYARVQLSYGTITAPCAGRVGALNVNAGNLVTANVDVLVTINAMRPVYVTFAVPEAELADLRKYTAAGTLAVDAIPGGDGKLARTGAIDLIDNQVDSTTGTINVRGTFPNTDAALWPGQYVTVVVTMTTRPNVLAVPTQALQVGQKGEYVYVIDADHKAQARMVTVTDGVDGKSVVEQGLAEGETVVVDGQMKLATGSLTSVLEVPPIGTTPPPAPESTSPAATTAAVAPAVGGMAAR